MMGNLTLSMITGEVAAGDNTDANKYIIIAVVMFIFIVALIITEVIRRKKK